MTRHPTTSAPAPMIVARGSMWEQLAPLPATSDVVYGRELTWSVNSHELQAAIADTVIARWHSLGIPPAGPPVSASAFIVPARYMPAGPGASAEGAAAPFLDIVHAHIGYQLVGEDGVGSCSWDRRTATACISDAADVRYMVEHLIQHVWGAAAMFHPPLYGLHAAAVVDTRGAVSLFVGESGVGKSSLVASLAFLHGFRYLTDDFTVVDGRSLRVYGRPWRIEVREGTARHLWPKAQPQGHRVGDKIVLDAQEHVNTAVSGDVRTVFLVTRGDVTTVSSLTVAALREGLGAPISMFIGSEDVSRGHEPVFDALAARVEGYRLTLNHDDGIARAATAVRDILG